MRVPIVRVDAPVRQFAQMFMMGYVRSDSLPDRKHVLGGLFLN